MEPTPLDQSVVNANTETTNQPIIDRHFGQSLEIHNINDGDAILVGGSSFFTNELTRTVTADFENFEDFLKRARDYSSSIDLSKTKQGLDELNMDIDPQLFVQLLAFTKIFIRMYAQNSGFGSSQNDATRDDLYRNQNGEVRLSDIYKQNLEECAEIAVLAQKFLQEEGVPSSYFAGEVLWVRDHDYGEPHSFIVIRQNGKCIIFDPTNPTITEAGNTCPSIYSMDKNFDEEIAKGEKIFVTARNLRTNEEAFFGTGNSTLIIPEEHIV